MDIDGRKKAEEALRKSEEKFRLVADFTYDWESWIGPDHNFIYVSPSCKRITGHDPGEFYRDPRLMVSLVHPDDRAAYEQHMCTHFAKTTGNDSIDFRIVTPQGETRWINHVCQPVFGSDGDWLGSRASNRDITERKQAEEALRRSEEGLKRSQEIAHLGSWELDLVNDRLSWSDEVYRIFGLSPGEFGATYEAFLDAVHPDDRAAVDAAYSGSVRDGRDTYEIEHRVVRKSDNQVRIVHEKCEHFRDRSGRIIRSVGMVHDITEPRQIIEKLAEKEKFLSSVFECIQDGISVLDKDLNIIQVNHAMEKRYGEHIIGKKCYHAYHGRSEPCEMCPSIRAINSGTTQIEVVDDLGGWSEIYAFPLVNDRGKVTGVIEHVRDINERKRTEEALKRSEANLERAQRIAALGNWEWDLKTNLLSGSREYYRIFDIEPGGPVPFEKFAGMVHPDDRKWIDEAAKDIRYDGLPHGYEFRILLDGVVKYIRCDVEVFGDKDGRPAKVFGTMQDITEHKLAEEELKAAKQQAELYLDLMSHDINNMHQVALGYLELAKGMPPGKDKEMLLDRPVEVLQRSTKLIDNLRKLEKLRNKAFLTEDVDVCKVLSDVQREYGQVPNKSVTLNLNSHEHCFVRANELLREVFVNLAGNAIKHTGDRANIIIDLDVVDIKGRYCRVIVDDDGPGITDDFKSVIFNRALKGTSKAKGMGLGLYLVKALVDSYGGRVWAEDRILGDHTKGARFVVMLPAVEK